jgi:peptidoglycan hydrolase-like protein with peptidoglycan-binding domain
MRITPFPHNRQSHGDSEADPIAATERGRWRKPAWGLAILMVAAAAVFATAATAAAATTTTAAPTAQAAQVANRAPTLSWPVVGQGATGQRVVAIQYLLNQQIGAGLVVDGIFGPKTEAAVKRFQGRDHLPMDGKVGPGTWMKLIIVVRNNSRGPAVQAVQSNLKNSYGYRDLAIDGIFGPKTEAAVKDFQRRYGLPMDGIVGETTWNALINHEK